MDSFQNGRNEMYVLADAVNIDWQTTIFGIVGGLGIFLYGINLMGES